MTITQLRNPFLTKYFSRGVALVVLVSSLSAQALRFEPADDLTIDLDTTLAYGAMWRVEERKDLGPVIPLTPGFTIDSFAFQDLVLNWNSDDGNRNFEKGDLVSNRYAVTSDFDMRMGDYGLFLRGQMFYDSVYFEETSWDGEGWDDFYGTSPLAADLNTLLGPGDDDCDGNGTPDVAAGEPGFCDPTAPRRFNGIGTYVGPESINNAMAAGEISDPSHFSDAVKDRHGYDARFLDAYVYGNFPIGDRNLDLRLGRQVLGWGEALMLQGGIGFAVNRIDASAATSPGVELKEIFLPTGMLYGQLDLSETLTAEAYWQYEWKPSELFATGSYFSAQDMLESDVLLTNTKFQSNCMFGDRTYGAGGPPSPGVSADYDGVGGPNSCETASDTGPGVNHWLQANYNAMYKAEDVEPDHESDQYGIALRKLLDGGAEAGAYFVQYHDKYPSLWAGNNGAKDTGSFVNFNPLDYIEGFNSARYTIEYRERINLFGLTYNTVINDIQMGFELTYRENQPIVPACTQAMLDAATFDESIPDGVDDFAKGLTMQSACKDASAKWYAATGGYDFAQDLWGTTLNVPRGDAGSKLLGWPAEAEVFTYNLGVTVVVPPTPLWDTGIFVGELGGWYVGGYENEDLKTTSIGGFTQMGTGFSAIFLPQYKNIMEGVDLTIPLFVNYTIDGSFSYFAYNEKALWASVGLEAVYLSNTRVGLVYSAFGGANQMWRDRDNIAFTMKYTF